MALLCGDHLDRLRVLAMASVVRLNGGTIIALNARAVPEKPNIPERIGRPFINK
jgi:hypothetical protein